MAPSRRAPRASSGAPAGLKKGAKAPRESSAAVQPRRPAVSLVRVAAAAVAGAAAAGAYGKWRLSRGVERRWPVACRTESSCGRRLCDRVVREGFATRAEAAALRSLATRGMDAAGAPAGAGGPTIFDLNSGFVLAPGAQLTNLHSARPGLFAAADYDSYRGFITRLKREVERTFMAERPVYLTAPTFITRLSAENQSWAPATAHDEYWHPHVDRHNTAHYEFSGLVYLSDHGADFQGGLFNFLDDAGARTVVEPRAGTLLLFASSVTRREWEWGGAPRRSTPPGGAPPAARPAPTRPSQVRGEPAPGAAPDRRPALRPLLLVHVRPQLRVRRLPRRESPRPLRRRATQLSRAAVLPRHRDGEAFSRRQAQRRSRSSPRLSHYCRAPRRQAPSRRAAVSFRRSPLPSSKCGGRRWSRLRAVAVCLSQCHSEPAPRKCRASPIVLQRRGCRFALTLAL